MRNEIFDIKLAFEKEKQTYEIKTRHTRSRIDEQAKEIRDIQEKIEELKKRNAALQAEIQTYRRLLESDKAMRKLGEQFVKIKVFLILILHKLFF